MTSNIINLILFTMKKIILLFMALTCSASLLMTSAMAQSNESDIIISEILYNPPGTDSIEFIEIYNNGSSPFDLNGCKIIGPFTYPFGEITIQPSEYYVIANDSALMKRLFGITTGHWGNHSLVNSSKLVQILDVSQNVLDSVCYSSSAPWPRITTSGGPSIELNNMTSDNSLGAQWKLSTTYGTTLNSGDTLFCSPGAANLPYIPEADFYCESRTIHPATSAAFLNTSFGNDLTYEWIFEGGSPNISYQENPTILYSDAGFYNVKLTASNITGSHTLEKSDYIAVRPEECEVISTLPFTENFSSIPECWTLQPANGTGAWILDNTYGYNDNTSLKFNCAAYPAGTTAKISTPQIDLSEYNMPSLSFYYYGPNNNADIPPTITIKEFDGTLSLLSENVVSASTDTWLQFSKMLNTNTEYILLTTVNTENNNAIYIDYLELKDRPANTWKVSGNVTVENVPVANVSISIDAETSATTDVNGEYFVYVDYLWSGIIKPVSENYLFSPSYAEIVDISGDMENVNFTACVLPEGWYFQQTAASHSFCILSTAIAPNSGIPTGSLIGVFYNDELGEHCCGAGIYPDGETFCLNAWALDEISGDGGFQNGNEIIWKVYNAENSRVLYANAEYSSGPEVFQTDELSLISSLAIDQSNQILTIPAGWSAISSYIIPYDDSLADIFATSSSEIIAVMNDSGIFFPNSGNSTLSTWNAESGWLIKTLSNITTTFTGGINRDMQVVLPEGWTLFPVKTDAPADIETVFADILDKVDIIKGYGNNEIYVPGITGSFDLLPGKAYKARLNSQDTVSFEYATPGGKSPKSTACIAFPNSEIVPPTNIDHVFIFNCGDSLLNGDIIGAFSDERLYCCGSGSVDENGLTVFKVFGDDMLTPEIDGMTALEKISFCLYRDGKTYNINVNFDPSSANRDRFIPDGLSLINKIKITSMGDEENSPSKIKLYPNPVDNILFVEKNDDIIYIYKILSVTGTEISSGTLSNRVNEIYLGDCNKGMMIISISDNNGWKMTGKIVK